MNPPLENLFEPPRRGGFPFGLLVFAAASATAIYFSQHGDYGTASAVAVLAVGLRSGYRAGATTFVGLFAGAALAMVAAVPAGKALEAPVESLFGTQGLTNRLLVIGTVCAIMLLTATLAVRHGARRLVRDRPGWQTCNRWLGLACGGAQASLLFLIMAGGVLVVEPLARDELLIRRAEGGGQQDGGFARLVAEQVVMAAQATRAGKVGPLVAAANPFQRIGCLKRLQYGVDVLQSPASLRVIAEHPEVEALREQPAYQQALKQLSVDPQLCDILSSGAPITRETLAALMNNPAIPRLLDDRAFMSGLARALADVDPRSVLSSTSGP